MREDRASRRTPRFLATAAEQKAGPFTGVQNSKKTLNWEAEGTAVGKIIKSSVAQDRV